MRFGMLVCTALLVMGMCLSAELLESSALIFPEIAALAFGAWATKARPWMATNLDMWLSPSVAGVVGIAVGRWLPLPFACQVAAAFALVLAWLWVTRSAVLPSISAAILPLVAGETSWIYPLSVCVFTGIIMLVCHVLDWRGIGNYTRVVLKSPPTLSASLPIVFQSGWRYFSRISPARAASYHSCAPVPTPSSNTTRNG